MLKRYLDIRDAIKEVAAVEELVPRPSAHRKIVQLVEKLEELDSVCVQLQAEKCTMADARLLFDAVLVKYPAMEGHLRVNANIVHSPAFEHGVVKLQRDRPLLAAEECAVAGFVVDRTPQPKTPVKNFAVEALRQAKKPRVTSAAKYSALLGLIPPTSNRCERLFSQCKLVLTPQRSSLLPANFEMIMFLRANRELWGYASLLGYEGRGE